MDSTGPAETGHRGLSLSLSMPERATLARLSGLGLVVSLLMLALAPLFIDDSYSLLDNTISESGAQGVAGAWVLRAGVVVAAASVLLLAGSARSAWSKAGRLWIRLYALGLLMLAALPESPWYEADYDATVAFLHTVSGASTAVAFIIGVAAVSASRPGSRPGPFDWIVMGSVALTPQIMLLVTVDGLLQRAMVLLGYIWLIKESERVGAGSQTGGRARRNES